VTGTISDTVIAFFNSPNLVSRTKALGPNKPLTEMSTRNIPWDKWWQIREVDNFTSIFERIF
jgi:hypothetical protein